MLSIQDVAGRRLCLVTCTKLVIVVFFTGRLLELLLERED